MAIGVCTMKFVLAYIPTGLVIEYLLQLCVIGVGREGRGGDGRKGSIGLLQTTGLYRGVCTTNLYIIT